MRGCEKVDFSCKLRIIFLLSDVRRKGCGLLPKRREIAKKVCFPCRMENFYTCGGGENVYFTSSLLGANLPLLEVCELTLPYEKGPSQSAIKTDVYKLRGFVGPSRTRLYAFV